MFKAPIKFWNSLVSRFALFFTGLLVFSILLSGLLVYLQASGVIREYSAQQIKYSAELAEKSFYGMLAEVSNDIAVISTSPTIYNYAGAPTPSNEQDLSQLFHITLEYKPPYFQIRWINNQGKEIIRLEKEESVGYHRVIKDIHRIPKDELEDIKDQSYFKEVMEITKGDLYFSEISLYEESGGVTDSYIPTLRTASPIFIKEDIAGIVIVNVDLSRLYKSFDQISQSGNQIYLIDEAGQYLYSPKTYQQFGIQQNNNQRFQNDFKVTSDSSSIGSGMGVMIDNNGNRYLQFTKTFSYYKGIHKLSLVVATEENILLRAVRQVQANSLEIILMICFTSILLSFFFTRIFSQRINQITYAISRYDDGDESADYLPENRKDEIGILARTFNKMRSTIGRQVSDLNDALSKEKKAIRQRDEFLQNMSHEMRTPLNAILGLTKLLSKNSPASSQLPILHSLERSASNLSNLVYDVLDHQKLVDGKVTIQHIPTKISDVLDDIYANYQYEAINKGLDFKLTIDPKLRKELYQTDPLRLSQIIVNLVVNAIKYTDKGTVQISANCVEGDPLLLNVSIEDTGVGILSENLNRINDRFFREREELSGRYGGYGLGLSIVKQLITLFGGTLEARSTKGAGSSFSVTIPLKLTPKDHDIDRDSSKSFTLPQLKGTYTILHIEDDLTTLELFQFIFNSSNIHLIQHRQLEGLDEIVQNSAPDIIISDLTLGEKKLASKLLEWINTSKVTSPLIVTSALEVTSMKTITPYYFQKPFDIQDLQDIVYRFLGEIEWKMPEFKKLYTNYDFHKPKIVRVLNLLLEEFTQYQIRITNAVKKNDAVEWESIHHKVIAHINTLQLDDLRKIMAVDLHALKSGEMKEIINIFDFYLCCIRTEIRLNSTD